MTFVIVKDIMEAMNQRGWLDTELASLAYVADLVDGDGRLYEVDSAISVSAVEPNRSEVYLMAKIGPVVPTGTSSLPRGVVYGPLPAE